MRLNLDSVTRWASLARLAGYDCHGIAKLLPARLRQIERHFHDDMKIKLAAYLHGLRMRDAEKLLHSGLRIFEIATLLGYRRPEHFARAYGKHFGWSPTAARSLSPDRSLEGAAFLCQYRELLEKRASDTTDPDERRRLLARLPV